MREIQNFTICQYKKNLEAITKKTLGDYIMQTRIFRASMYEKNDYEGFINSLQDLWEGRKEKVLTENELKSMGIGRKK